MRRRQILAQKTKPEQKKAKLSPADEYEARFGKRPHHRMKTETILERLNDPGNFGA